MIDAAEVLESHFEELNDALAGVDLAGIESAGWQLLIEIESLDKGLGVLPDVAPDFTNCFNSHELASAARRHIDTMDAHLIRAQRAQAALLPLLGAFEEAREASEAAEQITREIDYAILHLQQGTYDDPT